MNSERFPDQHEIDEFALGFYGYGDLKAPLWFIGMEEGGGNTAQDVTKRIRSWIHRGRLRLEDMAAYHDAFMINGFSSITTQNTWASLSRIQLGYEGASTTDGSTKAHWQKVLGRHGSRTCVLELNPLPSPSISVWKYPEFADLPFLANRIAYNHRYRAQRVSALQEMISNHAPRAVVFYGKKYEPFWAIISGADFVPSGIHKIASNGTTTFISMDHPNARTKGKTREYLTSLGSSLAEA